jgi:hypothetical protein
MEISVTKKAVVRRLQSFLPSKGQYLRIASRGKPRCEGLGRYYLVGANGVVDKDVDIEKLARELGLLDPWETLKE